MLAEVVRWCSGSSALGTAHRRPSPAPPATARRWIRRPINTRRGVASATVPRLRPRARAAVRAARGPADNSEIDDAANHHQPIARAQACRAGGAHAFEFVVLCSSSSLTLYRRKASSHGSNPQVAPASGGSDPHPGPLCPPSVHGTSLGSVSELPAKATRLAAQLARAPIAWRGRVRGRAPIAWVTSTGGGLGPTRVDASCRCRGSDANPRPRIA